MKYNIIICVAGFVLGYIFLFYRFPDYNPILFGSIPTVMTALAVRYLFIGNPTVKRWMLGALSTMTMAFVPASALSAYSVWIRGNYEPKFGAYGSWMISNMVFGFITFITVVGFAVWSTLLIRITRDQPTWLYLVVVAVPIAGFYTIVYSPVLDWAMTTRLVDSIIGYILIWLVLYSPSILLSVMISMIWRLANKSSAAYR